tara:strand:- start:2000 stop:2170 length:171 start_codon:yes stop_codon:yes gene_type:complete
MSVFYYNAAGANATATSFADSFVYDAAMLGALMLAAGLITTVSINLVEYVYYKYRR